MKLMSYLVAEKAHLNISYRYMDSLTDCTILRLAARSIVLLPLQNRGRFGGLRTGILG